MSVGERLAADLQWTQTERDVRFAAMDREFPVHLVRHAKDIKKLTDGKPLPLPAGTMEDYVRAEHLAGVLVLHNSHILAEQYALGVTRTTRWASFSVTKPFTDTLAGAALKRGMIRSLDDSVVRYLPEMRGSAYDGVTVRQLMTMTSGVAWNENYTSPDADNYRLYATAVAHGSDPVVEYMRKLTRESEPGARWHYNTGETDLLGVLLRRATGKTLADQLSAAVWDDAGMENDAKWIATAADVSGAEFGGSGLSATLRDFGRFGLWALHGGGPTLPKNWFAEATRAQATTTAGTAYGFGWWPMDDGSFYAAGIFGQSIFVDPKRDLVIVTLGDWDTATGASHSAARAAFWKSTQAAVDSEH